MVGLVLACRRDKMKKIANFSGYTYANTLLLFDVLSVIILTCKAFYSLDIQSLIYESTVRMLNSRA